MEKQKARVQAGGFGVMARDDLRLAACRVRSRVLTALALETGQRLRLPA